MIDDQGEIIGRQKMVHVAQCEMFYEQSYYTPSEEGFMVFDMKLGKIGIVVCFDRHYPESIRTEVLRGAERLLSLQQILSQSHLMCFNGDKGSSIPKQCQCSKCATELGVEGSMEFSGESLVAGFDGETIEVAGDQEELMLAEVNLSRSNP